MNNEIEITVKLNVPVGDYCYVKGVKRFEAEVYCESLDEDILRCNSLRATDLEIVEEDGEQGAIKKCQQCLTACEMASKPCETCNGKGTIIVCYLDDNDNDTGDNREEPCSDCAEMAKEGK